VVDPHGHLHVQVPDPKVARTTRAMPAKKRPQVDQAQKRREELAALQVQLSGLQKKLLEKDEALRSAENLIGRISAANEAVEELRGQLSEKESLIESTGSELHGAKVQRLSTVLHFALHTVVIIRSIRCFRSRKHHTCYCIVAFGISAHVKIVNVEFFSILLCSCSFKNFRI
jgi:hypothetical protein